MSEYMAAEIRIGGRIPASLVPGLCAAISNESISLEWGDACFHPATAQDLQEACTTDGDAPLLRLYDEQARWGEFDELEQFLREHGIAYTRITDGRYEYDAEMAEFRPDCGLNAFPTNNSGDPVVTAASLAPLQAALDAALAASGSLEAVLQGVQSARDLLREAMPPEVPALTPFEIVSETEE